MLIDLAPDLSLLVIIVIFLATYLVVRRFFLRPITEILVWRESEVRGAAMAYEEAMARLHEATGDMERRLDEARRENARLREERRTEAHAFREEIVRRSREEAETIVAGAEERLRAEVAAARERIETESEALARLAAERLIGRAV
jgi:F-type H+-transporting ATPase subunit b